MTLNRYRHEVPGIIRKIAPVPAGRLNRSIVLRDGAFLHRDPGTPCLATISLSLRDKSHSPIEAPHNYLSAYGVTLGQNPGLGYAF
jgi:hypothetical protein